MLTVGHAVGLREPLRVAVEHVDTVRVGDWVLEAQSVPLTVLDVHGDEEPEGKEDGVLDILAVGQMDCDNVSLAFEVKVVLIVQLPDTLLVKLGRLCPELDAEIVTVLDTVAVPLKEPDTHAERVKVPEAELQEDRVPQTVDEGDNVPLTVGDMDGDMVMEYVALPLKEPDTHPEGVAVIEAEVQGDSVPLTVGDMDSVVVAVGQ